MTRMKKILSNILIAFYLLAYTAPIGLCATIPQINTGVQKPVLRSNNEPYSLKLEGDISFSKTNPKISLSLRNSDVMQVLRMFADKAGLNIVFHSSVSGTVTLDLVNVPLNDAFKLIMQVTNLTYYIDNNTMVVASADAAQGMNLAKQELMALPVKYVDAAMLADFLNKNIFSMNKPGLSNSQIAVTNPATNEILIFGTKNDYLMAKKVIAQFDVKPLEETFVVNHSTPKEMASLLCNLLFKENIVTSTSTQSSGSSSSNNSSSSDSSSSNNTTNQTNPSDQSTNSGQNNTSGNTTNSNAPSIPPLSGTPTGGASSITMENNSDPSSDSLALGAGIIACQYNSSVTAGSLTSLSSPSLSITYFPQRGTIQVLGGSTQQMEMIKNFILKNDKKQPQAILEISLIELTEDGTRSFNNTWNIYSSFFTGSFNGGTLANNSSYPMIFGKNYYTVDDGETSTNTYFSKITGTPTVTYSMNYLIQNGKGRILANPKIMVTNGEKSTIDLSSDYIKTVTSQIMTSSGSLNPNIQKTYSVGSDEGIVVDMTPFISPEGYVTLNITPKYSTVKQEVREMNQATKEKDLVATLLQRRNLDLKNIRIKDGETLIIGGMIREVETKNVDKFPLLGDLPGIGMFFRNSSTSKRKEELVIMITPKIVKDSEDIVNNSNVTL